VAQRQLDRVQNLSFDVLQAAHIRPRHLQGTALAQLAHLADKPGHETSVVTLGTVASVPAVAEARLANSCSAASKSARVMRSFGALSAAALLSDSAAADEAGVLAASLLSPLPPSELPGSAQTTATLVMG
jgi:hypothetical protein